MRKASLRFHRVANSSDGPPPAIHDVLISSGELERGAPFCADPRCALHVRLADLQVPVGGNWATLPDGRVFGRGQFGGRMLCDACGTRRGPLTARSGVGLSGSGAEPG